MLNYNKVEMRYEPYPLAVLRPALAAEHYDRLAGSFPDEKLFGTLPKFPYKLSLSEKWAPDNYARFLRETKVWNDFHSWVKSDDFIFKTVEFLKNNHVDLPLAEAFETGSQKLKRFVKSMGRGNLPSRGLKLRSRFEFSSLKADGGTVEPHTDAPRKVITLVISMIKEGEWDTAYGGGLDVNRTNDKRFAYNWENQMVPWEGIEVIDTVPFVPNQCTVFVKTHNSLHSVRPMTQKGSRALRKSVTVVIERDE
jgi:hypothetical protein